MIYDTFCADVDGNVLQLIVSSAEMTRVSCPSSKQSFSLQFYLSVQ